MKILKNMGSSLANSALHSLTNGANEAFKPELWTNFKTETNFLPHEVSNKLIRWFRNSKTIHPNNKFFVEFFDLDESLPNDILTYKKTSKNAAYKTIFDGTDLTKYPLLDSTYVSGITLGGGVDFSQTETKVGMYTTINKFHPKENTISIVLDEDEFGSVSRFAHVLEKRMFSPHGTMFPKSWWIIDRISVHVFNAKDMRTHIFNFRNLRFDGSAVPTLSYDDNSPLSYTFSFTFMDYSLNFDNNFTSANEVAEKISESNWLYPS